MHKTYKLLLTATALLTCTLLCVAADSRDQRWLEAVKLALVGVAFGALYSSFQEQDRQRQGQIQRLQDALQEQEQREPPLAEPAELTEPSLLSLEVSDRDPLTGLLSRSALMDLLRKRLREPEGRVFLLLLGLDRFKIINNGLGHKGGDLVLAAAARRIRSAAPGAITARLGGDEFALALTEEPSLQQAVELSDRLLHLLKVPFSCEGISAFSTASVGIASADAGQSGARDLLRDAELAMRHVKAAGGGSYAIFDHGMRARVQTRISLESDLQQALHRRQMHLHYQPIVDLKSGEIAGFEALIRWKHPQRGAVCPSIFIPMAEENGLILPIGAWVIETACEHLESWHWGQRRRGSIYVNVNVSPRQLEQPDLSERISSALASRSLPASRLGIEITETALPRDPEGARALLEKLRRERLKICLDDFGTGYSVLSQIRRFPVDTLKIDRSFIEPLGVREEDNLLVRNIISMGHDLGLGIVAEGVETLDQLRLLQEMGCERAQGFFFSRALSPAAATELLHRSPPWQGMMS